MGTRPLGVDSGTYLQVPQVFSRAKSRPNDGCIHLSLYIQPGKHSTKPGILDPDPDPEVHWFGSGRFGMRARGRRVKRPGRQFQDM